MDSSINNLFTQTAREAIFYYLTSKAIPESTITNPELLEKNGAFVTIRIAEKLRGCIGYLGTDKPLYEVIREKAVAAATMDPRFPPMTIKELPLATIEVSVLSPPIKIEDTSQIMIGTHGLVIEYFSRRGVLLPEVPERYDWTVEAFLENLSIKAGLPPQTWKNADIFVFTTQVYSE